MKRFIVGAVALSLILSGCSVELSDTSNDSASSEVSASGSTLKTATESTSEAVSEISDDEDLMINDSEEGINNNAANANVSAQTLAQNNVQSNTQNNATLPCGVYSVRIHEITKKGEKIEYSNFYSFHKDGTGMYSDYDGIGGFKFDDKKLTTFDGKTYDYKLTGDHLRIELPNGGGEFDRLPGDDFVLNGDFWEFAGTYTATQNTNQAFGAGDIVAGIELDAGGAITGGQPLYVKGDNAFPSVYPYEITKNPDGSYSCQLEYYDDAAQSYYEIYPKGVLADIDKNTPELKDVVYIRGYVMDGGVYNPVFTKTEGAPAE